MKISSRFFSRGFRDAVNLAVMEWKLYRLHRRSIQKARDLAAAASELRLNLGCGPNLRSGWLNIDLTHSKSDVQLDLREVWPFENNSVTRVYSEHVFEHFDFPAEVQHFMAESLRVLKPGGIFDVGVPDTAWPLKAYGDDTDRYWHLAKTRWHPAYCKTHLDHINYHFRQAGQHKYAWDEPTLARVLRAFGFESIQRRAFDPALDSESRRIGTLYMRARKPGE